MLFLLFSLALASGPPVEIADSTTCDPSGYLAGFPDYGDCCSFVVCDNAGLNKTGFLGHCMGGTAWNQDLLVCDDPKYVTDCDTSQCDVPKRTTEPCTESDNTDTSCCAGHRFDADGNQLESGNKPLFTPGASGDQWYVMEDGKGGVWPEAKCPLGMTFSFECCGCLPDYVQVAPCDQDTNNYYYANTFGSAEDACCTYLQCWANRTGYDVVSCMPPSVWNDFNKTCDIPQNVMSCMTIVCEGVEMTDPPCPTPNDVGDCCKAGIDYSIVDGDTTAYTINEDPRVNCCPEDMNGVQMIFNFEPEFCCCEVENI